MNPGTALGHVSRLNLRIVTMTDRPDTRVGHDGSVPARFAFVALAVFLVAACGGAIGGDSKSTNNGRDDSGGPAGGGRANGGAAIGGGGPNGDVDSSLGS